MKKRIVSFSAILSLSMLGALVTPINSDAQNLPPFDPDGDDLLADYTPSPYGDCIYRTDSICPTNFEEFETEE